MLTIQKTRAMGLSLLLIAVLPVASPAQEAKPPGERERELRESWERRAREILEAQQRLLDEARELRDDGGVLSRVESLERARRLMPHEREGLPRKEAAVRAFFEAMLQGSPFGDFESIRAEVAHLRERIVALRAEEEGQRERIDTRERLGKSAEEPLVQLRGTHREIAEHQARILRLLEHQGREAEQDQLRAMLGRLEYVSNWGEVAFDARRAVMMATQAIVELGMARGAPGESAGVLEELLEQVEELGSRTAIRFALKNIYMEMDQPAEAHDQMVQVILENARGISPRPPRPAGQGREHQPHESASPNRR